MSNHLTLGPLHFDGDLVCFRHEDGTEDGIATLFRPYVRDEDEYNKEIEHAYGNLFAAAPDLLAALESACAYPLTGSWLEEAQAAIAKAKGERHE